MSAEQSAYDANIRRFATNNKLELDDVFAFGCNQCGGCCNMEDILLSPHDIIRASGHLGISPVVFVNRYCNNYIGATSRMPIFQLALNPVTGRCRLFNGKCTIHPAKPSRCALYPLGRGTDGKGDFMYFHVDIRCGNRRQKQTVREWLQAFDLQQREVGALYWMQQLSALSEMVRPFWTCGLDDDIMGFVYHVIAEILYLAYDPQQDPDPQVEQNITKLKELLPDLLAEVDKEFNKQEAKK